MLKSSKIKSFMIVASLSLFFFGCAKPNAPTTANFEKTIKEYVATHPNEHSLFFGVPLPTIGFMYTSSGKIVGLNSAASPTGTIPTVENNDLKTLISNHYYKQFFYAYGQHYDHAYFVNQKKADCQPYDLDEKCTVLIGRYMFDKIDTATQPTSNTNFSGIVAVITASGHIKTNKTATLLSSWSKNDNRKLKKYFFLEQLTNGWKVIHVSDSPNG